jgi:hypothetical protein
MPVVEHDRSFPERMIGTANAGESDVNPLVGSDRSMPTPDAGAAAVQPMTSIPASVTDSTEPSLRATRRWLDRSPGSGRRPPQPGVTVSPTDLRLPATPFANGTGLSTVPVFHQKRRVLS